VVSLEVCTVNPNWAKGIDIAHYDAVPDWKTIQGFGVSFVFHKATEGVGSTDLLFAERWKTLGEFGMTRGAYHFFHPDQDPAAQAHHFLSVVSIGKGDLPAALDVETGSPTTSGLLEWLGIVEKATGKVPFIYTSAKGGFIPNDKRFARYPLWVAHYNVQTPVVPPAWSEHGQTWTLWQEDEAGAHGHTYDVDYYPGSHEDLVARFHLS
jgi:lysozyme